MKKTGALLKKAREEKGLSLHEIGLSLKINSKILKSIEDGDSNQAPAKTFLRGFVQSYANYLRLDIDEVMNVFYEEMGSTRPKPLLRDEALPQNTSTDGLASSVTEAASGNPNDSMGMSSRRESTNHLHQKNHTKTILIAVLALILIGLIFFTKKMIDKYSKEAQVEGIEVTTPLSGQQEDPNVPTTTVVGSEPVPPVVNTSAPMSVATPTPPAASPLAPITPPTTPTSAEATKKPVNPTATTVTAPAATPAPTTPAKPATPPATAEKPATPAAAAPAGSPVEAVKPPAPVPPPVAEPTSGKPIELIIEALDNVQIEYSSNTGKKSTLRLAAEQVHTFKSKNGLKLTISNGGAVNIILNGRDMSIPGDLGKPITLSY